MSPLWSCSTSAWDEEERFFEVFAGDWIEAQGEAGVLRLRGPDGARG